MTLWFKITQKEGQINVPNSLNNLINLRSSMKNRIEETKITNGKERTTSIKYKL